jgi:3-hydroxyacyl-[acyl-carrier-protein] dehydratase
VRFLLVDEILALNPGKDIRARKVMAPEEELFQDHFPGFPVVPGVLLTEMMAQAAGKCLWAENQERGRPMLAKINSATFRDWVQPGHDLIIHAQIRSSRVQFATADCSIEDAGKVVAESSLMFGFLPSHRFALNYKDKVLEEFLARK